LETAKGKDGTYAFFSIVPRHHPDWSDLSEHGKWFVTAGKINGEPALCLFDDPARNGFDLTALLEQTKYMGVPDHKMIRQFVDQLQKLQQTADSKAYS
jgi:hypothetical protein